uniref:deoxynucleoside triphosphate triphosphohydrolase SAMHD1-like n=1 Tax=Styela clava TaxID=7725 RepID=UPI001939808A|nr:deoxynucleoside triphosphate triphosphohydrolase SAMHD1-like [Styela clava]
MGLDKIKIKVIEDKVKYTVFNDPVHGTISLHPFLVKIINTPQFQRLRNIKQLQGAYFVYPGACHNRFEHSIGTAHLAGKLVRQLEENQPKLGIDKKDILCVEIAGLCHDLGHGPFSHLFDTDFYTAVSAEKIPHEKISYEMLEYLLVDERNRFDRADDINQENLLDERNRFDRADDINKKNLQFNKNDWTFIKEMITGKKDENNPGRPGKEFLYEIISNERNKVDVDKWDYFARDCYQLGMQNGFDHNRFMQFMRVIKVDGNWQLCVHKKECFNLYQMFHTRYCLHRRAYQHPVVNAVEEMFTEALVHANEHAGIDGIKLSECAKNSSVFMKLDDGIFHTILNSTKKELEKSREILERIMRREIYQTVANEKMKDHQQKYTEKFIKEKIGSQQNLKEPVIVKIVKLNYGMKEGGNPIDLYNFYSKNSPDVASPIPKDEISSMLPPVFEEFRLQIFCKNPEKFKDAKEAFESWWKKEKQEALKRKSDDKPSTSKRTCEE